MTAPDASPPAGLAAVLFDMDGTLVDSEPLWYDVEAEVAARLGARWTPEDQAACLGGTLRRTAEYLVALGGAPVDPRLVQGWLLDAMAARLRRGVPLRPGARELLGGFAAAGVPRALVSSSYRRLVDLVLAGLSSDLDGGFAVSVAGDEVRARKPDPEPYLTATRLLGVPPGRCVVVEDSLVGIESGEAAGCVCVGVPGLVPIPATPARPVRRSLRDVSVDWLASLPAALAAG